MINNYSFNEHYKRFEPHETKCTYCEQDHMKSMNECYFVPLFVTNDRTNIVVYRSVKYSKILIGIPRCASCKTIHEKSTSKSQWITAGCVIVALILLISNFMSISPIVSVGAIFAIIFGAIYGSKKMTESFVVGQDIYTLEDGAERNDVVRDLILAGWSFTQPSA